MLRKVDAKPGVIFLSEIFYAKAEGFCDETTVQAMWSSEVERLVVGEVVAESTVRWVCPGDFLEHRHLIRPLQWTFVEKGPCPLAGQNFERNEAFVAVYERSALARQSQSRILADSL